jgi:nitrogen-specific signal transduction histidine kinase/CheY-like chemotaxis protein
VETKAFPLKDAAGNVTSAIEVINNMTDKHLLEEQILRTQKLEAVGLLAGGLAHDFNNLLQGVFGNISMAKMFSDKGGKAYAMLEGAETALYQATNLTKQLLTFSKGGEPVKRVIDLPSLVDNAVKFSLSGSNVNYRSAVDDRLWPVEADDGQINQVIHNIVLNACEAMPDGGTVAIEMQNVTINEKNSLPLKQGKYVQLDIKDSGTGISASHLPKIFDPYFTTKKKGSGLGLATSYSIVTKHGGMITASSQLGVGSVFSIYLPASGKSIVPAEVQAGGLLTGKGRILIMDDEEIVRSVAGHMIESLGYEVDFSENGEQAIEKYSAAKRSNRPFNAVILDLTVRGGMGGKEAVGRLAEIDPEVRAIVSSGYSADDIISNYREYGFQEVLSKPYQIDVLGRVLYNLLHRENIS